MEQIDTGAFMAMRYGSYGLSSCQPVASAGQP
jgi:hypothetical protein